MDKCKSTDGLRTQWTNVKVQMDKCKSTNGLTTNHKTPQYLAKFNTLYLIYGEIDSVFTWRAVYDAFYP